MLSDPQYWPQSDKGKAMKATMWIAIAGGVGSLICLVVGSVAVWRSRI